MSTEEAREALAKAERGLCYRASPGVMELADAYGAARELKGHGAECRRKTGERSDTDSTIHTNRALLYCGDGWYCKRALTIKETACS